MPALKTKLLAVFVLLSAYRAAAVAKSVIRSADVLGAEHNMGDERLVLSVFVNAFHGSSAIEALLLSSPQLTTLCNMAFEGETIWQCEPGKALVDVRTLDIVGMTDRGKAGDRNETLVRSGERLPLDQQLEFYGKHWNLDRPILFCKFCFNDHMKDQKSLDRANIQRRKAVLKSFETNPPRAFVDKGIQRLQYAEIILWRPLCLHQLSHHSPVVANKHADIVKEYFTKEITLLEEALQRIQTYMALGEPFITVGLHELVWSPADLSRRMLMFLPWLSSLDPSGNHSALKSEADFGNLHPPDECCGFDLSTQVCSFDGPEYDLFSPEELVRVRDLSLRLVNAPRGAVSMSRNR